MNTFELHAVSSSMRFVRFCNDFSTVLKSCRLQCVGFTETVSREIENVRTNYTITAFYLTTENAVPRLLM